MMGTRVKTKIRERDLGFNKIRKELSKADGAYVKVGVQSGAQEVSGGKSVDLVQIATIQEYGLNGIPQRSFLFSTITEKANEINKIISEQLAKILSQDQSVFQALATLGLQVESMVKAKITDGPFTALSERTIKQKGSSTPLINSGQLRQSIRYEVSNAK